MTQRNLDVSHKENCTSDLKETLPMTSRKLYPNQININKLKESQLMGSEWGAAHTPWQI